MHNPVAISPDLKQFYASLKDTPVYMQAQDMDIPRSFTYPLESVRTISGCDYYTSSIAYMLALAIYEGAKTIGVWGVDMLRDEEYAFQRPCVEYWLGIAKGRGIVLSIPVQSSLLKANHRYGYDIKPLAVGITETHLQAKISDYEKALEENQKALLAIDGARQECEYLTQFVDDVNKSYFADRLKKYIARIEKKNSEINAQIGAIQALFCELDYLKSFARGGIIPGGK